MKRVLLTLTVVLGIFSILPISHVIDDGLIKPYNHGANM
jgi:hypothetical protein